MPMHSGTLVPGWNIGQPVCSFYLKYSKDVHEVDCAVGGEGAQSLTQKFYLK
jgi:hypothetical protein